MFRGLRLFPVMNASEFYKFECRPDVQGIETSCADYKRRIADSSNAAPMFRGLRLSSRAIVPLLSLFECRPDVQGIETEKPSKSKGR